MLDPEALTFATDIQHALAKGNIEVEINQTLLPGQKPIMGIIMQGAVQAEINKLVTPFENAGFTINTNIDTSATEIKFAIGSKPPAY